MGSAMQAMTRVHAAGATAQLAATQITGTFVARISSVRDDGVRVVLPTHDGEREFGPCVIPIGVQGVGPATANTTTGSAGARPVTLTNAVALVQGLQVVVFIPVTGSPWIMAIAPTGT